MNRYTIELRPFSGGCHYCLVKGGNWQFIGARLSVFEAACAAFGVARRCSRSRPFSVRVV